MSVGRLPNESPAYQKIRDELEEAELALRDRRERVAELRRSLPRDTACEDYLFHEAASGSDEPAKERRLSQLFTNPDQPLVLMHFMFGGTQTDPCPMCTLWADGYDGVVPQLGRRANFAVAVAGDLERFRAYGRERGWRNLRLVSSRGSGFKRDFGFETEAGAQLPGVGVFLREGDRVRHFYSQCAMMNGGQFRGMDLLCPLWHFLDLTPEGRGDFMPSLEP
ncbi:MAG: DUF899 family protein [Myxococcota bacterium]|nr:DUF899 family protein [Myxococcota bacterium]